jgi:hypothetical protein
MGDRRRRVSVAAFLALLIGVALVVKFWWLIVGIVAVTYVGYRAVRAVDRHAERVEAERVFSASIRRTRVLASSLLPQQITSHSNAESTFCDPILDVFYANFVAAVGKSAEPAPRSSPQNSGLWFVSGDLGDVHGDCVDGLPGADCDIRAADRSTGRLGAVRRTPPQGPARPTGRSQDHD